MIEMVENAFQLVTTLICTVIALYRALAHRKRAWAMLALSSGVYFLGDLYWELYLFFYHDTPHYSNISYMSWYAGYLFLMLLIFELRGDRKRKVHRRLWFIPVFTVGMCVFYLQWGDWFGNITAAVLMSLLIWNVSEELIAIHEQPDMKPNAKYLCITILAFCAFEYASWTVSCYWLGDTLTNPYFWFDTLLSATFLVFPAALRKAVGK